MMPNQIKTMVYFFFIFSPQYNYVPSARISTFGCANYSQAFVGTSNQNQCLCKSDPTQFTSLHTPYSCIRPSYRSSDANFAPFFLWSKQKCDPLESCPLICLDLMSPHSSHLSLRVLRWHVTDSPIKMISQLLHSLLSVLSTLDGENQWDCGHGGSGDLKCVSHTRDRLSSFPWA